MLYLSVVHINLASVIVDFVTLPFFLSSFFNAC